MIIIIASKFKKMKLLRTTPPAIAILASCLFSQAASQSCEWSCSTTIGTFSEGDVYSCTWGDGVNGCGQPTCHDVSSASTLFPTTFSTAPLGGLLQAERMLVTVCSGKTVRWLMPYRVGETVLRDAWSRLCAALDHLE